MLKSLLDFFHQDLTAKNSKFNTDTHFWMPLMHNHDTYLYLLQKQNQDLDFTQRHFNRMQSFRDIFSKNHSGPLFSIRDVGSESYWWDFGNLSKYYHNNMKLLQQNREANALRMFYGWDSQNSSSLHENLFCDGNSILYNCRIASGTIKNSILMNVTAHHVEIQDSIILNSTFKDLKADHNLVYHFHEKDACELTPNCVKADIILENKKQHLKFTTPLEHNVKESWEDCLPSNPLSFADLNQLIHSN
jgi:ADP-glucose pyrophosphorylase